MKESFGKAPDYKVEKGYSTSEIATLSDKILKNDQFEPDFKLDNDPNSVTVRYSWAHPMRDEQITFTATSLAQDRHYCTLHVQPMGYRAAMAEVHTYTVYKNGAVEIDDQDEEEDVDKQDETSKVISGLKIAEQLRDFHTSERPNPAERQRIKKQKEDLDAKFETIAAHEILEQDIYHEKILQLGALSAEDKEFAVALLISGLQNNYATFNHKAGASVLRNVIFQQLNNAAV
ncbi:MAG: hypothetical protein EOP52_14155 [Sphingobacteriales bacterium]|nr:MAG: hypothetical protein EOP52_14155 [Sphingobacteriales bacterium]